MGVKPTSPIRALRGAVAKQSPRPRHCPRQVPPPFLPWIDAAARRRHPSGGGAAPPRALRGARGRGPSPHFIASAPISSFPVVALGKGACPRLYTSSMSRPNRPENPLNTDNHRPLLLTDLAGQEKLKAALRRLIAAARQQHAPLDHILFVGADGMGKAAFAQAAANESGLQLRTPPVEALDDPLALIDVLMNTPLGYALLIERMDRLSGGCEQLISDCIAEPGVEVLVRAAGPVRAARVSLPRFTILGTAEDLPHRLMRAHSSLVVFVLAAYTPRELRMIVLRRAADAGVRVDHKAAELIAFYADGSPERALTLFRRIQHRATSAPDGTITLAAARNALMAMGYA